MSRPLSVSFETHTNHNADFPEGEHWNQECLTKLGGSASAAPFSMHGAVNGLVPFFLAGHKMCVLLSHKDSGTLTGDSLESPMRLRNEMHYGGSLFVARSEVILCRRRVLLSSNSLECPAMLRFKGERKCGWHRGGRERSCLLNLPFVVRCRKNGGFIFPPVYRLRLVTGMRRCLSYLNWGWWCNGSCEPLKARCPRPLRFVTCQMLSRYSYLSSQKEYV
ncbi:hypothetical protein TcG_06630 [Trypanosoma cruzi]|nr:hypothetical protein TcG_06630 [Trypanosoma cruzi]